jgi:hypothetical protein
VIWTLCIDNVFGRASPLYMKGTDLWLSMVLIHCLPLLRCIVLIGQCINLDCINTYMMMSIHLMAYMLLIIRRWLVDGSGRIYQSLACDKRSHIYGVIPAYWVRSLYILLYEHNKTIHNSTMRTCYEMSTWHSCKPKYILDNYESRALRYNKLICMD